MSLLQGNFQKISNDLADLPALDLREERHFETKVQSKNTKVLERAVYRGPHRYSSTPMVRVRVDLGALEIWPSHLLKGFNQKLLEALPGLNEHGCCFGQPGGFVRRLEEGTWFGHVVEHVALELQYRAGNEVSRGKTRSVRGKPGVYDIMFAYEDEDIGTKAARLALQVCDALLPEELSGEIADLDKVHSCDGLLGRLQTASEAVEYLKTGVERKRLGPSTQALVDEANAVAFRWNGSIIRA